MNKIQDLRPYTDDHNIDYGAVAKGPNVYMKCNDLAQARSIAASLNAAYQLGYAERVLEENIDIEKAVNGFL